MNKTIFRNLALAAALFVGGLSAQAQKSYQVADLNAENAALAQTVVDQQLADPDAANKAFTKLIKGVRKDKEQLLSVGDFFLTNKNYPAAVQCSNQLYTLDPQDVNVLMFRGEVFMFAKKYGEAGQCFDQALAVNPDYVPALKRNAFVYKNVNPYVAIETLNKIKGIEPDNYDAEKELGDIYFKLNDNKQAIVHYGEYYKRAPKDDNFSILSCENYMMALFSQAEFSQIKNIVAEIEPIAPGGRMLKRMKFISNFEAARNSINYVEEMAKVEELMGYITNKEFDDTLYLYIDYAYAAEYMKELKNNEKAIEYYTMAFDRDNKKIGALTELAKLYRQNKQYDEAIAATQKYVDLCGEKAKVADYLRLGQTYVFAAQQDGLTPEKKDEYVKNGDAVLVKVLEMDSTAYQAMLYRARINIKNGNAPEELPKQYYEEAIKMMEGRDNITSAQIEAYRYLAFYSLQTDDFANTRLYVDKILAIQPENAFALQLDGALKSIGK